MERFRSLLLATLTSALLSGCGSSVGTGPGFTAAWGRGQVAQPDTANATFVIQPLTDHSGFQPNGDSVEIHTVSETRFLDRSGGTISSQQWYDYVGMNAGPSTTARATGRYTDGRIEAWEVRLE